MRRAVSAGEPVESPPCLTRLSRPWGPSQAECGERTVVRVCMDTWLEGEPAGREPPAPSPKWCSRMLKAAVCGEGWGRGAAAGGCVGTPVQDQGSQRGRLLAPVPLRDPSSGRGLDLVTSF